MPTFKEIRDIEKEVISDLFIDKDNLDDVLENIGPIYFKWAERHSETFCARDKVKEELARASSDLDLKIRRAPEVYLRDIKLTEGSISQAIARDKGIIEIQNRIAQLDRDVKTYENVKLSLEHKRSGATNLSKLWLGGYWAEPRGIVKQHKEAVEDRSHGDQVGALNQSPRLNRRKI